MNSKKMINLGRLMRRVSVMMLLFGALTFLFIEVQHTFAQTGAPPPPTEPVILPPAGSLVIDAIFPAIPPANIPPLVGNGTLAVIPQNAENAIGLLNALLSDEIRTTLLVPASDTTDLIGKIQEVETAGLPAAALPVAFSTPLKVFQIDIFDAETGELITSHNPPLQIGIELSPGVHPEDVALLHFSASKNKYEIIDITGDPIKGIVKAEISETSPFALVSTAVSPDLAKAEEEGTSSQGETIAQVQPTPSVSEADTSASAEQVGTQADDGSANRSLFGSATDGNGGSQSLFGAPTENENESENDSASSESASVASAYDSAESQSNSSNNSPLLSGFAVLITSLGAGFGFLRWRFNGEES